MDTYEAGHDSSLTANTTKSLGNPYNLKALNQLTVGDLCRSICEVCGRKW